MTKDKLIRFKVRILADFFTSGGTQHAYTGKYIASKLLDIIEENPAPLDEPDYIRFMNQDTSFVEVCSCGKKHIKESFVAELLKLKDSFIYSLMTDLKKAYAYTKPNTRRKKHGN